MTAGVGIVGCGDSAGRYAEDLARQPNVRLVAVTDLDSARAAAFGAANGARIHPSLDELLADPEVEIVANLASWSAHVPIGRRVVAAGRHLFSEKPLATTIADASALLAAARDRGVLVGAAPIVHLGELAQTARRWLDEGRLGPVRMAYAEVNWGWIEAWHPQPRPFYEIGPLFDVGIYPMTLLTALLGPVEEVRADARRLKPSRVAKDGSTFEISAPDWVLAMLTFASGVVARLTVNFYVADPARQRGIELHGDAGSLWLSNWFQFGGTLEHAPRGGPWQAVPLLRDPEVMMPWAAGLDDLARAARDGRAPATGGAHATHVIDVLETVLRSAQEDRSLPVGTRMEQPPPAAWMPELPLPDAPG